MLRVYRLRKTWMIETSWPWLIRLAWGPRRVSSKATPETTAYPPKVSASAGLWLAWIRQTVRRKLDHVVIAEDAESGYGARYVAELKERAMKAERLRVRTEVGKRLKQLQQLRDEARRNRDFETADRIRAEIESAGFVVSDQKLSVA